ncbi:MAG: Nif3-like dinuclear metal center hexameric protein [Puia sp.]|nr:Nif3-like dinuclear metal center hexameric protein [Puia sp.]
MSIAIASILSPLESLAPLAYQEHYDNAGLLTGDRNRDCSGVLTTLDITPEVVEEAIKKRCNLIVAHHPVIFGGLKRITGENAVERTVIAAIRHDIAVYSIHTNLDNVLQGVNGRIADRLGLQKTGRIALASGKGNLQKLYCFVPAGQSEQVRNAIFAAGGGEIGNYSECSFQTEGAGTFRGGEGTHPFVGQPGIRHVEKELKIEVILPAHRSGAVVAAMIAAHPYEEPAYDLVELVNRHPETGSGLIGQLPEPLEETVFLEKVKNAFRTSVIRHSALTGRPVRSCAVCGGAGSFLISNALSAKVDFFITADLKYHEFFQADGRLVLADIGHFESEQFTTDLLYEILREKFPNFAVLKSDTKTNPVNYYS